MIADTTAGEEGREGLEEGGGRLLNKSEHVFHHGIFFFFTSKEANFTRLINPRDKAAC